MSDNISNLIRFIVCYAAEHDTSLTSVRLVKFLYLADYYHARWHQGRSFTGLPWAFIYYGPYCRQVMQEIDGAVAENYISRKTYSSQFLNAKDFALYGCEDQESESFRRKLPHAVVSELKEAIRRFGDETASLLDYVYFDTEPMMNARKGDILDFSLVQPPLKREQIALKKLPKNIIERAKGHAKELADQFARNLRNKEQDNIEGQRWKDDIYYKALECWDGEELEVGLKGTARIE